jgi:very-short-patch-repair endonuclease
MRNSQNATFIKKYGMHPMKTDETKKALKTSIQKKYGVDWISKKDGWYNTIRKNNLQKYGAETFNNREQIRRTCIEKYGVDNPTKYKEIRDQINNTKKVNHYNYLTDYCSQNDLTILFDVNKYKGYKYENKYRFQCNKCNYVFDTSINNSFGSLFCEKCNPNRKVTLENSFFDFLSNISPTFIIKRRDRTILYGKELDFYLPDQKIAMELDGLYWHSESGGEKNRHYHLNKFKGCIAHGIRLLHIFENEWRDKPELVKSVIKTILKCNTNRTIYARKCEVKEVPNKEKQEFLDANHLQQTDKSTIKLGLYESTELISLMTFRKTSRFDKSAEWELSRFCNLKNVIVMGGASRLFKHFTKTYNPTSIVSYNDRRYFSGDLYSILGFDFIGNTPPSYHYITRDYKSLINRMNFQKHKLSKVLPAFDPDISEWENMKNNGWDRIWDCGHGKWMWNNTK